MAIDYKCGSCGHSGQAKDELAARTVKCPRCGAPIRLPRASSQPDGSRTPPEQHSSSRTSRQQNNSWLWTTKDFEKGLKTLSSVLVFLAYIQWVLGAIVFIRFNSTNNSTNNQEFGFWLALGFGVVGVLLMAAAFLIQLVLSIESHLRNIAELLKRDN